MKPLIKAVFCMIACMMFKPGNRATRIEIQRSSKQR